MIYTSSARGDSIDLLSQVVGLRELLRFTAVITLNVIIHYTFIIRMSGLFSHK